MYNTIQYNTITLFKEGSAITCYSFLTYGPQGVWVMIILARSVPEVERVTSTVRDFILYIGWTAVGRIKKERTGEMHHTNLYQTVRKEQFWRGGNNSGKAG